MTEWTQNISKVKSDKNSPFASEYLNKIGAESINHCNLGFFGEITTEFLESINKIEHVYTNSDKLSKLAQKYYRDPKLWWVIAWFNQKPTDSHCKVGDIIEIPIPLRDVLFQAHKVH